MARKRFLAAHHSLFSPLISGGTAQVCLLAILLLGIGLRGEGVSQGMGAGVMRAVPGLRVTPLLCSSVLCLPSNLAAGARTTLGARIEKGEAAGSSGS